MRPRLTIRRKIVFGFLLFCVCLGISATLSYSTLEQIETRIHALERIDDIQSSILDFRRQEKNYLLYGEESVYALVLREVDDTLRLFHSFDGLSINEESRALLTALHERIILYRHAAEKMHASLHASPADPEARSKVVRDIGKDLVDRGQELSNKQRAAIVRISNLLRNQLLAAVAGLALFVGFMFFGVYRHIMRPLKIVESTTAKIAQGEFCPFQPHGPDDEIRQVHEAFNRMMLELQSRHNQLVQSQKLSSIGTLSAGMAHQLNNPLNNISTSAQILADNLDKGADAFNRKMLNNIERETARARDIVRGLLDFARHSELSIQRLALRSIADTAVSLVSSQVPSGVSLVVDIPDDLYLDLDKHRMAEALINLILNATQAIACFPGQIRLYTAHEGAPDRILLVVEDSGQGIAPDVLPRIFDPFFTSKKVGEGTGLGLSIVYGIVQECGGRIRAESQLGVGTRFFIDLPLPGPERRETNP